MIVYRMQATINCYVDRIANSKCSFSVYAFFLSFVVELFLLYVSNLQREYFLVRSRHRKQWLKLNWSNAGTTTNLFALLFCFCVIHQTPVWWTAAPNAYTSICVLLFFDGCSANVAQIIIETNSIDAKKIYFENEKKRSNSILLVTNACILKRFNYNIKSIVLCVVRSIGVTAAAAEET